MGADDGNDRETRGIAIGIALALPLGMILGLVLFDNIALGLTLGLPIGVAVGIALDARRRDTTERDGREGTDPDGGPRQDGPERQ